MLARSADVDPSSRESVVPQVRRPASRRRTSPSSRELSEVCTHLCADTSDNSAGPLTSRGARRLGQVTVRSSCKAAGLMETRRLGMITMEKPGTLGAPTPHFLHSRGAGRQRSGSVDRGVRRPAPCTPELSGVSRPRDRHSSDKSRRDDPAPRLPPAPPALRVAPAPRTAQAPPTARHHAPHPAPHGTARRARTRGTASRAALVPPAAPLLPAEPAPHPHPHRTHTTRRTPTASRTRTRTAPTPRAAVSTTGAVAGQRTCLPRWTSTIRGVTCSRRISW
jgi:hypothetical protein